MQTFSNKILSIALSLVVLYSCGKKSILGGADSRLIIKNNSDKRIYAYAQINHPDTTIGSYNPSLSKQDYEVLPHSEESLFSHSWEQDVVKSKSDTLMMFLYEAQTVDSTPWDTVVKRYMILKRYDLSLADLQRMNWTITYP